MSGFNFSGLGQQAMNPQQQQQQNTSLGLGTQSMFAFNSECGSFETVCTCLVDKGDVPWCHTVYSVLLYRTFFLRFLFFRCQRWYRYTSATGRHDAE